MLFYEHEQHMVPNMNIITTFFSGISQQILNIYEQNCHNYSNLENPASNHGGICEDGQTDGQTNGLDPFLYSLILLRWSRKTESGNINL